MSVPPGGYYVSPPPPAKSSSGGCFKAAGLTCGVLFLLGLVGVFLLVRTVKKELSSPGNPLRVTIGIATAATNGMRIRQAVMAYHAQYHKYPATLTALVSANMIDGKLLHSDLDPVSNPGHISWKYIRPTEKTPGYTPILELPYQLKFGNTPQSQAKSSMIINLDGTTTSPQPNVYGQPRYRSRSFPP